MNIKSLALTGLLASGLFISPALASEHAFLPLRTAECVVEIDLKGEEPMGRDCATVVMTDDGETINFHFDYDNTGLMSMVFVTEQYSKETKNYKAFYTAITRDFEVDIGAFGSGTCEINSIHVLTCTLTDDTGTVTLTGIARLVPNP